MWQVEDVRLTIEIDLDQLPEPKAEELDWWQSVARRQPDSLHGTQGVPPSAGT